MSILHTLFVIIIINIQSKKINILDNKEYLKNENKRKTKYLERISKTNCR